MENKPTNQKTQVFNVIILDRSGSMECIRKAAVDGFNETLAGIKKAQEKFADTQEHFVSLVTFCSCEMRKVFDRVPVAKAHSLTMEDYTPCCCTPLYDAMGFTITAMRNHVKDMDDVTVVVTIITDGEENCSEEYDLKMIKNLIEKLKTQNWTFTFIGTDDLDVESIAQDMDIDNHLQFSEDEAGTRAMFARENRARERYNKCRAMDCKMEAGSYFEEK